MKYILFISILLFLTNCGHKNFVSMNLAPSLLPINITSDTIITEGLILTKSIDGEAHYEKLNKSLRIHTINGIDYLEFVIAEDVIMFTLAHKFKDGLWIVERKNFE